MSKLNGTLDGKDSFNFLLQGFRVFTKGKLNFRFRFELGTEDECQVRGVKSMKIIQMNPLVSELDDKITSISHLLKFYF